MHTLQSLDTSEVMLTCDPVDMILPLNVLDKYNRNTEIAWVEAYEMFRGCPIWVPACSVFYPYYPDTDLQLFAFHTNGLASGNTIEEAMVQAISEIFEHFANASRPITFTCAPIWSFLTEAERNV